jgi:Tfp pilus assembly protein PilF
MRRQPKSYLLTSLVCSLLVCSAASAQSISGHTIIGKVRRQSGEPVSNVLVQLETGNGVMITQTVTTNEGDFAFSGLEGASFIIVVNEPNHDPFGERVELARTASTRPGETIRVEIVLTQKPQAARPAAGTVFQQNVPDAARDAYRRGVKLLTEHKSAEGVAALNQAIKISPSYFDAHFALALEMIRLHRHDEAIAELERARAVNPRDGRLYHVFGLVLFEQKKYPLAAKVFEAAARVDPTNAEARLMLGASLIEVGLLNEAEQEIKRADQISAHKLTMVHLHLARVYEKRGDRPRAADELETYLRKNPGADNAPALRDAIKRLRAS